MSEKSRFRTSIDSQHAKGSSKLPKSLGEHFYQIFHHSVRNWITKCHSWWYVKSSDCLSTCWLPMIIILLVIVRIFRNQLKCSYIRNKKLYLHFLRHFCIKFWTFWKKDDVIAYVFLKLKIAKDMVREMSQKLCFRTPFNSQHAKGTKTLLKSAGEHI